MRSAGHLRLASLRGFTPRVQRCRPAGGSQSHKFAVERQPRHTFKLYRYLRLRSIASWARMTTLVAPKSAGTATVALVVRGFTATKMFWKRRLQIPLLCRVPVVATAPGAMLCQLNHSGWL
jgi:hypothetical protein